MSKKYLKLEIKLPIDVLLKALNDCEFFGDEPNITRKDLERVDVQNVLKDYLSADAIERANEEGTVTDEILDALGRNRNESRWG